MECFSQWLDHVIARVRFWPDRSAIAAELTAHYEDHVRDLERLDYPPKLARQRALNAMGDPEIVGKALDRVHKPWLGWLWKFSRWILIAAFLVLIWAVMVCGLPDPKTWMRPVTDLDNDAGGYGQALSCPPEVEMGPYTLRTDAVWYAEGAVSQGGWDSLILDMTSTTWRFWLEGPLLYECLEAVDSNGVRYTKYHFPYISASNPSDGHIRHAFWIQVDGIENDPAWIEITHRGAGWTIRVDLPGREEATP